MKLQAKQSGQTTRYYLQTTVTEDGKRKQKSFAMGADKKTATTRANRFLATLEESGLTAALEELDGGNPIKKGDSPTHEQIEKLYKEFLKQSPKALKDKTVYDNVMALKRIMKACNAETITEINSRTLRKKMLTDKPSEAELRGFNSTITHAKSIFKPACMSFYKSEGIKVENPFNEMELSAPQIKPYVPLSQKVLEAVKQHSDTLPACEQIILSLVLDFGLRRIEAEHCKTTWFTDDGDKVFLSVQNTDEFKVKVNEGRVFPVSREIYEKLISLRKSIKLGKDLKHKNDFMAYVHAETPTARLDRRFKNLTKYLKTYGVTGDKPIQRMRKEAGSKIASETSIFEAQRILGHSSPDVTAKHYANIIDLKTVGEFKPKETPEELLAKQLGISLEDLKKKLGI